MEKSDSVNFKTWGTPIERVMRRVEFDANSGCWLWAGSTVGGYGRLRVGGQRKAMAHRVSYESHIGPIPDGMWVLHKCDVPACCNPAHLFLGDVQANVDDMRRKGRDIGPKKLFGAANPMARLSGEEVEAIRRSKDLGRVLADRFSVSESNISRIRRGVIWTDQAARQASNPTAEGA